MEVSLSAVDGVGALGSPVKVGEARVAYAWPLTNAVVAIWVVFVATPAVGATGVPVKVGEARVAYAWALTNAVVAI
jgi:hypothetical protein